MSLGKRSTIPGNKSTSAGSEVNWFRTEMELLILKVKIESTFFRKRHSPAYASKKSKNYKENGLLTSFVRMQSILFLSIFLHSVFLFTFAPKKWFVYMNEYQNIKTTNIPMLTNINWGVNKSLPIHSVYISHIKATFCTLTVRRAAFLFCVPTECLI